MTTNACGYGSRLKAGTTPCLLSQHRRVGKANGSRERAPDDKLRVPTISMNAVDRWWAQRKRAFAHPTNSHGPLNSNRSRSTVS